ncbi:MAG: S-layer homology domain-containing protein, partial [Oscillospiraceae bacterium]|nr:S-layer homology domain-containing protein [Oscillospiraceae bacterium]
TASSNNTAWGTVKQSGRRITAVPNEGYFAEDYTVLSGSAKVERNGNVFTVTPESDCSIRINFAPRKAVTATFNAGVESITAYAGDEITLPTASAPQDYRFMGWVTETIEDTTTKPSFYEAGSKYTLAADTRFYALFAWSDGESFGEWTLIRDSAELHSGMELVLASTGNNAIAAPLNGKYFAKEAAKFSQDGNVIEELPESAVILTLGGQTNAWTLAGEDGKLLGVLGNKNIGWDDGSKEWKITVDNGNAVMYSANESYGRILYNVSSPRFTTYTNAVSNTLVLPQLYTNGGGKIHYTTEPTQCQHTDVLFHEAVEATCTENGTVAYYSCKACGRFYAEETCATELTDAELVVKALGHAWDEGTVTLSPTATEPGIKTFRCTRCDEVATESIPATGEEDPGNDPGTNPEDPNCEYGEDCGALIFTDMPAIDNWAHKGIDFVVKEGLFNGVGNGIFAPNKTMTRAMLVTVLWRCAGEPEAEPAEFSDVATDKWYSKAVAWAAAEGVVNGLGDGTFRPDNQITREQLATILFRYVKLTEMDPAERADLNAFPDAEKVQPYAQEAFQWAVAKGLVNGVKNTSDNQTYLMPAGSATRAQVATILMRFLEN